MPCATKNYIYLAVAVLLFFLNSNSILAAEIKGGLVPRALNNEAITITVGQIRKIIDGADFIDRYSQGDKTTSQKLEPHFCNITYYYGYSDYNMQDRSINTFEFDIKDIETVNSVYLSGSYGRVMSVELSFGSSDGKVKYSSDLFTVGQHVKSSDNINNLYVRPPAGKIDEVVSLFKTAIRLCRGE